MASFDLSGWREAVPSYTSWSERASASWFRNIDINVFPSLYGGSGDDTVADSPGQRARSTSVGRRGERAEERTGAGLSARPRSVDSVDSTRERARRSMSLRDLALGEVAQGLSSLRNDLPSVPRVPRWRGVSGSVTPPHATEGDEERSSKGRPDKMPMAWALSEQLAEQFWGRKWAKQNGRAAARDKLRVLILMCETGGGHKASAKSLADALEELSPAPLDISIVDAFVQHTTFPWNKLPRIYSFLASKPRMWEALYKTTTAMAGTPFSVQEGLALSWIDCFTSCIVEEDPDIIVSVHPLMQDPVSRVVRRVAKWKAGRKIPFVTVVTDLVCMSARVCVCVCVRARACVCKYVFIHRGTRTRSGSTRPWTGVLCPSTPCVM